jgi:hypothetical protein
MEATKPIFWGYITKSKRIIVLAYRHERQVASVSNDPTVTGVICPFRAESFSDAQEQISNNYESYGILE